MNNTNTFPPMSQRRDEFKKWLLKEKYEPRTADNYASNVQKCSDYMSEHIERYDFYRALDKAELNEKASRLLNDVQFKNMDAALHAQCSNALKRYCEFIDSLSPCPKALARLAGVYQANSIVHEIIQRAIDLGCSDQNYVCVDKLTVGRAKRGNIRSMTTERGHSYGQYFCGTGRGTEAKVRFAPVVWKKLRDLGWVR